MSYNIDDPKSVPEPSGVLVTLTYGQAALRVAIVRSVSTYPARFAVTELPHTPVVWPSPSRLVWPPDVVLDDEALQAFGVVHLPPIGAGTLHRYGPLARG